MSLRVCPLEIMRSRAVRPLLLAILFAGVVCAADDRWTNVGPDSWGPASLVFDPQNSATVYTATSVGLFKSSDGGITWNNAGLTGWSILNVAVDPDNPGTLYAVATWDAGIGANQLFKSTDGGISWDEADSGLPMQGSWRVEFLPIARQSAGTLYVLAGGPSRSLFKSTDGGANWMPAAAPPGRPQFIDAAIDPQNSNNLYAESSGTDSLGRGIAPTVFRSIDGGASWQQADSGLGGIQNGVTPFVPGPFGVDPKNAGTLYVSRLGVGVYKSTDGGASWRAANSGLPNLVGDYEFMSCCSAAVIIDPRNPSTLYVAGENPINPGIFKSTNGGATWKAITSPIPAGSGMPVLNIDAQGIVYTGVGANLFKSADGGATWLPANFRLRDVSVPSLAIDPQNPGNLYVGVYRSTNSGIGWDSANISAGSVVSALAIDPMAAGTVYAGTSEAKVDDDGDPIPCGPSSASGIFKSVDGGVSWTDTQAGIGCLSVIAVDPQDTSTVYAGSWYHGVYKSLDGGRSWRDSNSGLPAGTAGLYVTALALDPKSPETIYAGTAAGLFKSSDGGASWSGTGLMPQVAALAIDAQNSSTVYAVTANRLFQSTDGGANWRTLFSSSPANVSSVVIHPQNSRILYAGTDSGVAQSIDGGANWTTIPGAPTPVRLLAIAPQDPNSGVEVGTSGGLELYAGGPSGLFVIGLNTAVRHAGPAK
jgi:hypothetical protein